MATDPTPQNIEANFSTLILSIGSQAAVFLGLAPNPATGKTESDKKMAKFNIDLLVMLQEKTKNNLSADEQNFLNKLISDLQIHYVQKN